MSLKHNNHRHRTFNKCCACTSRCIYCWLIHAGGHYPHAALLVKSTFPDAFVFYNEGGAPLWGNYDVNRKKTVGVDAPRATCSDLHFV